MEFIIDNICGIDEAFKYMRYPMDSNSLSDSIFDGSNRLIGERDKNLCSKLVKAGVSHRKHLRFIDVYCTIIAPMYFFTEFDTYTMGVSKISSSTMHTIHKKEFEKDMFSLEYIKDIEGFKKTIEELNRLRNLFLETKNKDYWYELSSKLPRNFLYKKGVKMNYEAILKMYQERKTHKLKEWNTYFVDFVKRLPFSSLLIGE